MTGNNARQGNAESPQDASDSRGYGLLGLAGRGVKGLYNITLRPIGQYLGGRGLLAAALGFALLGDPTGAVVGAVIGKGATRERIGSVTRATGEIYARSAEYSAINPEAGRNPFVNAYRHEKLERIAEGLSKDAKRYVSPREIFENNRRTA